MKAITVNTLSKSYANVRAIQNLSFEVERGEIYGVIGADGAGKTTLFRILTTLMLPDSGDVKVEGFDVVADYKSIRNIIGYMPGRFSLYTDLTVEENLSFFATIFDTTIKENYYLIEDIYRQIEPFKRRRAGALSGGMKQKLALSCALIHKPKVLFLDEPTTGVDPVSRKEFWDMLFKLKAEGITMIVSTPYMDEATRCDRIALIKDGQFLQVDAPSKIVSDYSDTLFAVRSDSMHSLMRDLRKYPGIRSSYSFGETYHITLDDCARQDALRGYLADCEHRNVRIDVIEPTIEDCFMRLSNN